MNTGFSETIEAEHYYYNDFNELTATVEVTSLSMTPEKQQPAWLLLNKLDYDITPLLWGT